jgi:hypothetical protein
VWVTGATGADACGAGALGACGAAGVVAACELGAAGVVAGGVVVVLESFVGLLAAASGSTAWFGLPALSGVAANTAVGSIFVTVSANNIAVVTRNIDTSLFLMRTLL